MVEGGFPKSDGDVLYASEANGFAPPGAVCAWLKTFGVADSGQDDAGTADKLTETGQNFETTVEVDMIVHNTSDDTFANVTAIDSNTVLSLDADIMDSAEDYIIYKTTKLPDGWVECNGQVLSDATSIYNGETIPDLNASAGTARFLRGAIYSGATGGTETHAHDLDVAPNESVALGGGTFAKNTGLTSTLPSYYSVVWIIRIK